MQEHKKTVESHLAQAERAEWKRPRLSRLEAYDAEATRGGLGADAIYS
jgi:hypothetical protein